MTETGGPVEQIQLVCASPQMRRVAETVRMSRGRPLLLTGETGVGKDALARWAHTISPVAGGPFVAINCAAIHDPLWESEIFGHAKGAFTGAVTDKPGQVERAAGGTLFLNEIGDMPLATQAKLLTFLDTGEFHRVGDTEPHQVDTRVIAATNRDLEVAIEAGAFRRDLFYRLAGVHVRIPPLCERPTDVLGLAQLHLQGLVHARGARPLRLADPTRELLVRQRWKGNVRELQSVIETAFERCLSAEATALTPEHFAPELHAADRPAGDTSAGDQARATGEPPAWPSMPALAMPQGPILADADALRSFLDQMKTPSGRWNISAAHRLLVDSGRITIGRRAFARRVRLLFPSA